MVSSGLASQSVVTAAPVGGGQSNPTFRVTTDHGDFILRKKPAGHLLPSAHAIDREYRVMQALAETGVPVPRMLAWCESEDIVGTSFYVMEFLKGRVFLDPALPTVDASERREIYREMLRVIARLHAVDPSAIGLEGFGRGQGYVARQVALWSRQLEQSTLPVPPVMRRLMEWLPENIPGSDEIRVVHGDFRLDNLLFHPSEPRVLGVLDWELSTLGDPLADFSYHCMAWRIPPTLWRGIAGLDLAGLGIPSEEEHVRGYAEGTRRDVQGHLHVYMAYNLFRIAAILHGIGQRVADGTATAPDAAENAARAEPLAAIAWECALRHQATTRA